ncbi:MAG: hypothetical protein ABIA76_03340 [Candidatus Diapherotrites archaeon]
MEENDLIQKISINSGKSIEEVNGLIEAKKTKFSGLLTDAGAAFMVSKELGVALEKIEEAKEPEFIKLKDLNEGQTGIGVECMIKHIFSPKKFEKNGKKGKLCNLLISDNGEEVRLTLWHNDVKKFFEQGFERGDLIKVINCNASKFNDKMQLSMFNEGKIELVKKGKNEKKTVNELIPGMIDVDLLLKIQRCFEEKEFTSNERKGKLVSFIGEDTSGSIRGTAWNELTEIMHRIPIGKPVLIEGAYTKEGLNGTELHLGWQARILLNPRESKEVEKLNELNKIERKKFNEIKDKEFFEERAVIVDLMKGNLFYLSCSCGRKAVQGEKGFECEKCGAIEPKPKAVVSAMIDDGFGCLRTSFFGKEAEKLLRKTAEEIDKMNEEKKQEFIEEKKNELIGKEIIIQAKAKMNQNSQEMELMISGFQEADVLKEIKERIKEVN